MLVPSPSLPTSDAGQTWKPDTTGTNPLQGSPEGEEKKGKSNRDRTINPQCQLSMRGSGETRALPPVMERGHRVGMRTGNAIGVETGASLKLASWRRARLLERTLDHVFQTRIARRVAFGRTRRGRAQDSRTVRLSLEMGRT